MRKSKVLCILLALCLVISVGTPVFAGTEASFKTSDYVQFGEYWDQPIVWRVVDVDTNGNPMLITDKILDVKTYDIEGSHNGNGIKINNNWAYHYEWGGAVIRQWLNSDLADASEINFPEGENPYLQTKEFPNTGYVPGEGGFLSRDNFSATQYQMILPVVHKSYLIKDELRLKEHGDKPILVKEGILSYEEVAAEIESSAYREVTDRAFLISTSEMLKVFEKLGKEGLVTDFTDTAKVQVGGNKNAKHFMLRDCIRQNEEIAILLMLSGSVLKEDGSLDGWSSYGSPSNFADPEVFTVRPGIYLDVQKTGISSGSGTKNSPYIIGAPARQAKVSSAKVTVNGNPVEMFAYNIDGNNYFKLRDIAKVISGSEKQFDVTWDNTKKAINMETGKAYTVVGGELKKDGNGTKSASLGLGTETYMSGQIADAIPYTIEGNNYFKLRELGKLLDISIQWDNSTQTIKIDTSKKYAE